MLAADYLFKTFQQLKGFSFIYFYITALTLTHT
nr:MAG TPA: hypothetical protein [Caudoviricetes sp.]